MLPLSAKKLPVLRLGPLVLLLLLMATASPARAQLSDEAQISLITILPGDAVYSLWGHSALRVYDPLQNYDRAFNYGTFDFGDPLSFVAKFSYGQLDYFLSIQSYPALAEASWHRQGRPVIEQVLRLDAAQRNTLFRFLQNNALPENRTYRYNFLFDNCSTRIRDAFETLLDDAVTFAPEPTPHLSFRHLIDPYAAEHPFLDFGMDLGLGLPADRIATARETMFLPMYLMEAFDHATVSVEGQPQPLVVRTDTVYWSAERATLDPAWPWPSLLFWGVLALGLWLIVRDVRAARTERRLFDGVLFGVAGVAGLLIVFLWFISLHTVTHGNLNLLWAWPTHLLIAWVLIRRRRPRWLRGYLSATALLTLVLALSSFFFPQEIPAAALPLLLLLAARSGALAYGLGMKRKT